MRALISISRDAEHQFERLPGSRFSCRLAEAISQFACAAPGEGIEPRTPTKGAAMLRYLVGKRRRHSQRGQVFALTAMAMVALCGVAGFSPRHEVQR
jgi:hypothetical protein